MSNIKLFESKQIRSAWNESDNKWYFSIADSIPSPKAEPFKRWLAKVGYERLEEIENPELAAARMRELYKTKGYSDEWIEKPWAYTKDVLTLDCRR